MLSRSCLSSQWSSKAQRCLYTPEQHFVSARRCQVRSASVGPPPIKSGPQVALADWLQEHGAPRQAVEIRTVDMPTAGRPLDMVVSEGPVSAGQVVIDIPEHLVVTLDRIFESEFVAELLTNDKLSELACLTLYMMYEKKSKEQSFWAPYIKELDRQRARGAQAVESPLLWDDEELEELLKGSPLLPAVRQRLAGIREEYEALDTVWFMASSLFNKYPFDIPTEAFPFERFRQAFAAVQASIVHLQGVPVAKRFALVPLGPPLLSYSSTSKAMLSYNQERKSVQLVADRDYKPGELLTAWCGPQPNSRLLLNYGLVDEHNPYDKLQMTVTIPNTDPLFRAKRAALQPHGLATQQTFDLARNKPLPPALLPFMRLALATTNEQVLAIWFPLPPPARGSGGPPPAAAAGQPAPAAPPPLHEQRLTPEIESSLVHLLSAYFNKRLNKYRHPLWRDMEIINDPTASPRQKVAARLTKIEKSILIDSLEGLKQASELTELPAPELAAAALAASAIKFTQP